MQREKIRNIDFLKIDVEGDELNVLYGASNMLEMRGIKAIQFEFGGTHIDSRTYFRDFWNLLSPQYDIYRVIQNGLHRICKYTELLEIFACQNFLAILK